MTTNPMVSVLRKEIMSHCADCQPHLGDPFAVVVHRRGSSEIQVIYEDLRFAPITASYARTFAAALLAAADAAEEATQT